VQIMDSKVEYWFGIADYDFETAKAMLETKRYLYVGFMCHQAIEKALKAIIAHDCANGEMPPRIHDLTKLSARASLIDDMSSEQQDFLEELNPLNIEARYPENREHIAQRLNNTVCQALIKKTEALLCWIKKQL